MHFHCKAELFLTSASEFCFCCHHAVWPIICHYFPNMGFLNYIIKTYFHLLKYSMHWAVQEDSPEISVDVPRSCWTAELWSHSERTTCCYSNCNGDQYVYWPNSWLLPFMAWKKLLKDPCATIGSCLNLELSSLACNGSTMDWSFWWCCCSCEMNFRSPMQVVFKHPLKTSALISLDFKTAILCY